MKASHYRGIYSSTFGIVSIKPAGPNEYLVTRFCDGSESRQNDSTIAVMDLQLVLPNTASRLGFNHDYDYLSTLWTHSNLRSAIEDNIGIIEVILGARVPAVEVKLESVQHCYDQPINECWITIAYPVYDDELSSSTKRTSTFVVKLGKDLVFGTAANIAKSIRNHANAVVKKKILELSVDVKSKNAELKKLRSIKF